MSRIQSVRNLNREVEQCVDLKRLAFDQVPERLSFEQLHGDERLALMFANFVNRADIGMVERGRRLSFTLEPFQCLAVLRQSLGQELECDEAMKLDILGLVDDTHAAAAEFL